MSKLVRIILFAALAIFIIGFIWAIVAAIRKPDTPNTPPTNNQPTVNQPAPETPQTQPAPSTPAPAEEPKSAPSRTGRTAPRHAQPTEPVENEDNDASAWANAWVDEKGNSFAEAHAE